MNIFEKCAIGPVKVIEMSLDKEPGLINLKDDVITKKLLNTQDERLPIHHAVSGKQIEVVEYLIQKGSSIDAADDSGWTPLHISCSIGNLDITLALLNAIGYNGNVIDCQTENGCTPLHYAASKGHSDIVKALMDREANISIRDNLGQLALHRAALIGQISVLKEFIKSPKWTEIRNIVDRHGNNALHYALEEGHGDCALLLIQNGVDNEAKNRQGKTPMEAAEKSALIYVSREIEE